MTDRIVIAQSNNPQQPAGTPTKTVQINKPLNEQAIVIHLDGATKLDLSAIANESITLVHIGDRLIIIFENHAQITLEPFYGDNGQPLTDLTVELGPGRDVSSSEFATLFPVTTDESVLPASGGPNAPSSGGNFESVTVDPFSLPSPLPFLPPDTFSIQFTLEPGAPLPPTPVNVITLSGASLSGDTFEGGLATDTINTVGNHPGEPTVVVGGPGALNALVNFGPAGPGSIPFEFVSQAAAQAWLTGLHLTSQGMAVDHVTIVGNTLTASTDPAQTGQPTNDPNPHDVFSLTVNPDGSVVFTLLSPFDDANPGHLTPGPAVLDQITLNLSGFIEAIDAQGNILPLSNDVFVNVHDDAPVLITTVPSDSPDGPIDNVVSGIVEESALASGTPGDMFGSGNGGGTASISGDLNTLVAFGADGPDFNLVTKTYDGFQLVSQADAASWLGSQNLVSHGQAVDFAQVSDNQLIAWTGGGPTDLTAHEVFAFTLNGDGTYTFTLINPLDHPDPGHATPGPEVADAVTIDMSGLVQAIDFDGDTVTLSSDFAIDVIDDVPQQVPNGSATAILNVDEGGLTSGSPGDIFGSGNDHGVATSDSGSVSGIVSFGADGPDIVNGNFAGFQIAIANNSVFDFGLTSHGQEVDFVNVTNGPAGPDGISQILTAWTGLGPTDPTAHEVFTFTLNGDGTFTFQLINPVDQANGGGENVSTIDLSSVIAAVDFDGDQTALTSGTVLVNITDDIPVAVSNTSAFATLDEGGLASGTLASTPPGDLYGSGNDTGAETSATVSLSGSALFGADGPAGTPFQFVDHATADTWLTGLNLFSHGQQVDFAQIVGSELIAWTGGGPTDPNAHEVFSVALNGSNYTFQLINPFDDLNPGAATPGPAVEDSVTVDLSGLIQAVDFDADAVTLSGGASVTVIDDVPVAVSNTSAFATVDEGGLTSGTVTSNPPGDLYGSGNDQGVDTSATESLSGSVLFGADGPAATPFQFVDQATASFWLSGLNLTSHGQAVDFAQIVGNELTGWTAGGPSDPAAHEVFSVTLNGSNYTFQLINPFDDPIPGSAMPGMAVEDSVQVDLSGLIRAVDFDGDAVTLSGGASVTVIDDIPDAVSNTASATVDEGALTFSTTVGDVYGNGNDPGAATSATVSLSGAVQFGADGPSATPFQFVDHMAADNWLSGLNLTSHGQAVDFAAISGDVLTAWTGGGPTDPSAHEVFTVTLNSNETYTFQLINPFDDPNPGHASPGPAVEDSVTLDLSGLIQAVDFDGDAVTLSGDASVTVIDDIPVATGNLIENGNFAGGNFTSAFWGGLTTVTNGSGGLDWLLATSAEASPSNQAQPGFVELERINPGYLGTTMPDGSYMVDLDASPGDIQIAQTVHGLTAGQSYELAFWTAASVDIRPLSSAELEVFWGGQLIETITPTSETPAPNLITITGGAGDGSNTLTFAEVGTADFVGTYIGDVALEPGTPFGIVDEGGLTAGTPGGLYGTGNDPRAATVATGTLSGLVSFGADGPDFVTGPGNVPFNAGFSFSVAAGAHDLGVKSHGQEVNFIALSAVTEGADGTSQTLTAWTNGGAGNGGHEVFTLTLNGDGTYAFNLINPLDQAPGMGENALILDLSALVQATDYDGDTVPLASGSFQIDVIDDVPVLTTATLGSGSVDESALVSASLGGTDQFGQGNVPGAPNFTSPATLDTLVHFGADGPNADQFQFTVANGGALNLGITSHGQAVDFAVVSGNTLTAWTGTGPGDPTAHDVFSLSLNADDTYTFTLLNPPDFDGTHVPGSASSESTTLDLGTLVAAVDFDGDSTPLAPGSIAINILEDGPAQTGALLVTGSVDEGALAFSTSVGDLFGNGNDQGSATFTASGTLAGQVIFGADGPAFDSTNTQLDGFQFVGQQNGVAAAEAAANAWLSGLGLFSHGVEVDNAMITFGDGTATLVASTDPNSSDPHEVFKLVLNGDGTWTFTLLNPVDHPAGDGENALSIDLTGLVQATDYDGDTISLTDVTNGFTRTPIFSVSVTDDLPIAQGNLVENGNFSGGEFTSAFWGGLTTVTDGSGGLEWLLATSAEASPSNQAQPGFVELERITPGYLGSFMPDGSFMADLDASPGDIQISQTIHGITTGQSYQLEFWTATSVDVRPLGSAVMEVFWGGQLIETVTPTSEGPTPNLITVVGGAGDGSNTLTFAEVGTADFVGTYLGDVALEAGTPFGIVDEGGLTLPFQGDDPGAHTVASGSIAGLVSFGADGPAAFVGSPDVVDGFQFVSNAEALLASMGLNSEGSQVNHVTLVTNPAQPHGSLGTASTTLEAFTQNGHEAFTLTLEGDGAWQFQLLAPLDNPAPPQGAGEDSTIIDFSKLVNAIDFDGDVTPLVSGSFTVDIIDDVPAAANVAATMAANAQKTVTLSEPANFSFGADGPGTVTFDTAAAMFTSDPTGGHLTLPTANQYTINGDSITLNPGTDFQTLDADASAILGIPYTVTDHDGDSSSGDIFITINGVNSPPTTSNNTVSTAENVPYTFQVADFPFSDPINVPPNILQDVIITSLPALGTLTDHGNAVSVNEAIPVADITNGDLVFTPPSNSTTDTSFQFEVQDNGGTANGGQNTSSTATMTIDATPPPDAITTHAMTIAADQGNGQTNNAAGPEATANTFSIPVLSLLEGDSSTLGGNPLTLTVTGVSGDGATLTNDHQYVLVPFASGTFNIAVSDGTTSTTESVTVDYSNNFKASTFGHDGNVTETNSTYDFLIENFAQGKDVAAPSGNDVLVANTASGSQLWGGSDQNPSAGGGNDLLVGSAAGDNLFAGDGSDTLWGRGGGDQLYGNTDANVTTTFYFGKPMDGNAVLHNFDSAAGQDDVIAISAAGFDAANAGANLSSGENVLSIFTTAALTTSVGSERFHADNTGHLYYSYDGTSTHEVLLATVTNHSITGSDIHVVA